MAIIDLIFSWSALAMVVACITTVQVIKIAIDYGFGARTETSSNRAVKRAVRTGADLRKQHEVFNELVLPAIAIVVGIVLALCVAPLRPAFLESDVYWDPRLARSTRFALWGGLLGVLADYCYTRLHRIGRILRGASRAG